MKHIGLLIALAIYSNTFAQKGLEGIYVETYYVSNADDATDTHGGMTLAEGSVTYRIYADLASGYALQAVFGSPGHPLQIETSTYFFNQTKRGNAEGGDISVNRLPENTLALDSWITIGTACSTHHGVPKDEDSDGSMVGGKNSDGGSAKIEGGILKNEHPAMGLPLFQADGMMPMKPERNLIYGLELAELRFDKNSSGFISENGAWSVPKGIEGLTPSNKVLVAQLTTTGELRLALNLQLLHKESGTIERWMAVNPLQNEFSHPSLTQVISSRWQ